jgi:hypothetical protein
LTNERVCALNEGIIEITVYIDTLNSTATLTRIKHRPIDDIFDREAKICIGSNIGRIFAPELEAYTDEAIALLSSALDGSSSKYRSHKAHEVSRP